MRMDDAVQYLEQKGVDPRIRESCAMPGCSTKFVIAYAKALPGPCGKDEEGKQQFKIFFFCSYECYLSGIPTVMCGSA